MVSAEKLKNQEPRRAKSQELNPKLRKTASWRVQLSAGRPCCVIVGGWVEALIPLRGAIIHEN
jgi:hypothetical protein